jgi:hypothetical protein
VIEAIAKEITSATQNDGGKFAESLKEDNNAEEDFAESLKEDSSAERDFAESLKEDNSAEKDFAESLRENREGKERETQPLTDEDREKIKQDTSWSNEIVDDIKTKEECDIYKNAGLEEQKINDKSCLIRTDIDMNQKDDLGRTNRERMNQGLSPIARNGETVELHHIGQKSDSPLAELTTTEHRGKGNDTILHDKKQVTQIDRGEFKGEKETHWEARAKQD